MTEPKNWRRVVILGHTGFMGRALHRHLERDREVTGHSSASMDLCRPESLKPLGDIVDEETAVVLMSARTPDNGDNWANCDANIRMAGNVCEALLAKPPGKFIFISSDAVYPMGDEPVTEATPVNPEDSFYALAKFTGECLARMLLGGGGNGVPVLILRPTIVFGPGDTHQSYGPNRFARTLAADREIRVFGQGEETRDHLYIDDAVRLIERLVFSDAVGTFNLVSGVSRSFAEIVEGYRKIAPFEFSVTHATRKGEITHRQYDASHLTRQVPGFEFTDFDTGLRATLEFFSDG